MQDWNWFNDAVSQKGGMPALVQSFGIYGLHEYRDISLTTPHAAGILIARNGSGKTTLLAALHAFLKGQFYRLADLKFREIRCTIRGIEEELVLPKAYLEIFPDTLQDSEAYRMARSIAVDPHDFLRFLSSDLDQVREDTRAAQDDPIFSLIYKAHGYSTRRALDLCERLQTNLYENFLPLAALSRSLKQAMKGVEVVYLPTYRRVELPLIAEKDGGRVVKKRPRLRFGGGSLFSGNIQFGLSDISDRLSELYRAILFESNSGYRTASADIIRELMDGTFDRKEFTDAALPTQEDLGLFFSRVKEQGKHELRYGSYRDDGLLPDMAQILTRTGRQTQTNKFLIFFLSKLSDVINRTKGIEAPVTEFIEACNKYLSISDDSTSLPHSDFIDRIRSDDKVLRVDRENLSVYAQSVATGRRLSIDVLSSGEKQMVSLFASLFLYPHQKIVLIDEPELSLSLDWQRRILTDVITAPTCAQFVAITHSPFVFDNPLEPFARPLETKIDPNVPFDQSGQELELNDDIDDLFE